MILKKIITVLILMGIIFSSVHINLGYAAKEKPVVYWAGNVYYMGDSHDKLLERAGVREAIAADITSKLKALEVANKLPFELKTVSNLPSNTRENFSDEVVIGLIPLVLLDESFESHFNVGEQYYYKAIVASAIHMAICVADPDTQGWRIIASVPMEGASVKGTVDSPITEAIPYQQEIDWFIELNHNIIQKQLDFKKVEKLLRDIEKKQVDPITYQVTSVDMSSQGANEVFGEQAGAVKAVIGNFFTSAFQKKTGCLMYPPMISESYARIVGDGLRAFTWHSPSDTIEVTFPEPRHKIKLDFSGVASQEVKRKDESFARRDVIYKVWLKGNMDGKAPVTLDTYTTRNFPGVGSSSQFDIPEEDTYMELMTELPKEMANKLAKME